MQHKSVMFFFTGIFSVTLVLFSQALAQQPKSAIQFYDTTTTNKTSTIGWTGDQSTGHFFVTTPQGGSSVELIKGQAGEVGVTGNVTATGTVTAAGFSGSGATLTGIPQSGVAGLTDSIKKKVDSTWVVGKIAAGSGGVTAAVLADSMRNKASLSGATFTGTVKSNPTGTNNSTTYFQSADVFSLMRHTTGYTYGDLLANVYASGYNPFPRFLLESSSTSGHIFLGSRGNYDLGFSTNDNLRMLISAAGDVGIGATNPGACLQIGNGGGGVNNNGLIVNKSSSKGYSVVKISSDYGDGDFGNLLEVKNAANTKLIVNGAGNVGIGTPSPKALLHVESNLNSGLIAGVNNPNTGNQASSELRVGEDISSSNGPYISLAYMNSGSPVNSGTYGNPNQGAIVAAAGATNGLVVATNANAPIKFHTNQSSTSQMIITGSGYVGIGITDPGQYRLNVNGDLKVAGSVSSIDTKTTSDRRFKQSITPLDSSLEKVTHLQGVSYDWNRTEFPARNFPEGQQIGLIAQDVEKVIPEVVHTDSDGYKSLSYDKLTAVLIEAVKELRAQVNIQDSIIKAQSAKMELLEANQAR